jgi:hypothetical protein
MNCFSHVSGSSLGGGEGGGVLAKSSSIGASKSAVVPARTMKASRGFGGIDL